MLLGPRWCQGEDTRPRICRETLTTRDSTGDAGGEKAHGGSLGTGASLRGDYLAFTEKRGLSVQDPLPKFTYIYKIAAGGFVG
jgi:hypothetical protein